MANNRSIKMLLGIIVSILIVAGATLFFKRSNNAQKTDRILRIHLPSKVTTMDPHEVNDLYEAYMVRKVYEPLLTFDHTTNGVVLTPLLLEKLPEVSNNNLVYTLTIKKGVYFHDSPCFTKTKGKGREITADDVAYSFIRLFDPDVACKNLTLIEAIKGGMKFREARRNNPATPYAIRGIQVIDRYTLRIILDRSIPDFPYFLAMPFTSVVSKEAISYYKDEFRFNPVGTGAWKMDKTFNPRATKFILKKNPDYHSSFPIISSEACNYMKSYVGKKLPLLDELHIEIITEHSAAWLKFKNRELDIAYWQNSETYKNNLITTPGGKKEVTDELKKQKITVQSQVPSAVSFLHFNLNVKQLQNVKVRQALALAADLERIIRLVSNNYGKLAHGVMLPGFESQGYDPDYKAPYTSKCDVAQAKRLLTEAGYPEGKGLEPFTLYLVSGHAGYQKIGECIKEDWGKIGVRVNLVNMPFHDLLVKTKKVGTTTWSGTFIAWGLDVPDMINMFQVFYGKNIGGNNPSSYNSQAFNTLYEKAAMIQPGIERTRYYIKMNKLLAQEVPSIPLYIVEGYDFVSVEVKNLKQFNSMVLDQEKYIDVEK